MRKRTGTRPQEEGGAKRPRTENLSLDDLQSWVDGVLNEGRTPQLVEYLPNLSKASVVALHKKLGLGVSGGNREELVRGMQHRLKTGGPPPTLSILKQPSVRLTPIFWDVVCRGMHTRSATPEPLSVFLHCEV